MGTKFSDFMREVEDEAAAEGAEAVAQLDAFREHYRLGRKLAEARLAKSLTQKQVARRARIDQADLSKIERGVGNPTFDTLNAVAFAVGLEVDLKRRR